MQQRKLFMLSSRLYIIRICTRVKRIEVFIYLCWLQSPQGLNKKKVEWLQSDIQLTDKKTFFIFNLYLLNMHYLVYVVCNISIFLQKRTRTRKVRFNFQNFILRKFPIQTKTWLQFEKFQTNFEILFKFIPNLVKKWPMSGVAESANLCG